MQLRRTIHASIRHGDESDYVAECGDLHVVTQGATLDEVARNLREAIALALEGEDLSELGLTRSPIIVATMELGLAC